MTTRSPWFLSIARHYARRRIARSLDGVYTAGLDGAREQLQAGSVLFAINHVSWWDPILLLPLDAALGAEGYALMDAANLRRLPFFGWVGAIPLDRSSPSSSRLDLKAAAALLSAPNRSLWIFPQGRQRSSWLRPLDLKPGIRLLGRLADVPIVPVSLTYAFREAPQPCAVFRFGAPLAPRRQDLMSALEASIVAGLDENDRFIEGDTSDYSPLISPKGAPSEDGLGARILALFGGHR
ncbi:MAG: 1-acyl-sn-glycerol-3-phosphate acyltransferase [Myxococcota bacterium]